MVFYIYYYIYLFIYTCLKLHKEFSFYIISFKINTRSSNTNLNAAKSADRQDSYLTTSHAETLKQLKKLAITVHSEYASAVAKGDFENTPAL